MNREHDANPAAEGSEFPRAAEEALELLNLLLGDWKGRGRGGFPTFDSQGPLGSWYLEAAG
ncbi:MAG TPA: hypothetical protein VLA49_08375 [Anaerolineales bacterium]|nr:hypothetical protein [Anaerolineales bacterium]